MRGSRADLLESQGDGLEGLGLSDLLSAGSLGCLRHGVHALYELEHDGVSCLLLGSLGLWRLLRSGLLSILGWVELLRWRDEICRGALTSPSVHALHGNRRVQ